MALDLPTSWQLVRQGDDITQRMLEALKRMMLDMLAGIARKNYEDRRRRTTQGIAKAPAEGRYRGRPEDTERNTALSLALLAAGSTWAQVIAATGCSRSTLNRLTKAAAVA